MASYEYNRTEGPEANVFDVSTPYGAVRITFDFNDYDRDPRNHHDGATVDFRLDGRELIVNGIAVSGYQSVKRFDPPFRRDNGELITWSWASGGGYLNRADGHVTTDNMRRKIYDLVPELVERVANEHPHAVNAGRLATMRRRHAEEVASADEYDRKALDARTRASELQARIVALVYDLETAAHV